MDGIRGILALSVVFHHAEIYHRFLLDSVWTQPPSHFFSLIGPVGVGLFFMITGFLFWTQLIRTNGRPSWISLYVGRVFRIGPLYLFAVTIMLSCIAYKTHFIPHPRLWRELVRWLSLGLLASPGAVNGYGDSGLLLADVTWTLQWEWYFYLALPVLALFTRRKGWHLWSVLCGLFLCVAYIQVYPGVAGKPTLAFVMLFLIGMLSASLRESGMLLKLPDTLGSLLIVALLIIVFQADNPTVSTGTQFALGLVLYLVISGCSLFGLLRTRAAIRLGDISYGIYLLQGLVLAAVFRGSFLRRMDSRSPLEHWLLCLSALTGLIVFALATHVWIERPGILAGKRITKAIKPASS